MQSMAQGYGLIEGPVWLPGRGLLFSDVIFGGVYCLVGEQQVETVFEHRRGIGGMALHADGGLIVSGRSISHKPFDGGATVDLLSTQPEQGLIGFNDITTDAHGRIYAGGLGADPLSDDGKPAAQNLYLIDLDGSSRAVGYDIRVTNGLGFAPDGQLLYHSDTARRAVYCYDVAANGDLSNKRVFVRTDDGLPDGLVVSQDGAVWVALVDDGYGVAVYEADGSFREHIKIPHPTCTSVCFGGVDLQDLYIVSGSHGLGSERGGGIFKYRSEVPGVPVSPARTPLPAD